MCVCELTQKKNGIMCEIPEEYTVISVREFLEYRPNDTMVASVIQRRIYNHHNDGYASSLGGVLCIHVMNVLKDYSDYEGAVLP